MPGDDEYLKKVYDGFNYAYGQNGVVQKGVLSSSFDEFRSKMQDGAYAQKVYNGFDYAYGKEGVVQKGVLESSFQDFYAKGKSPSPDKTQQANYDRLMNSAQQTNVDHLGGTSSPQRGDMITAPDTRVEKLYQSLPAMKEKKVKEITANNLMKAGVITPEGSPKYNEEKASVNQGLKDEHWMPSYFLAGKNKKAIEDHAIESFAFASHEKPDAVRKKIDSGEYLMQDGKVKVKGGFIDNYWQALKDGLGRMKLALDIEGAKANRNTDAEAAGDIKAIMEEYSRKKSFEQEYGANDVKGHVGRGLGEVTPYVLPAAVSGGAGVLSDVAGLGEAATAATGALAYADVPMMGFSNMGANHEEIWGDHTLSDDEKATAIINTSKDAFMIGAVQQAAFHSMHLGEGQPTANTLLSKYAPTANLRTKFAQKLYDNYKTLLGTVPSDLPKVAAIGGGTEVLNSLNRAGAGLDVDFKKIPEAAVNMAVMDLVFKAPKVLTTALSTVREARRTGYDKVNPQWFNQYSKGAQDALNNIVSAPPAVYDQALKQLDSSADENAASAKIKIQTFRDYYNNLPADLPEAAKHKALHILQLKTEAIDDARSTSEPGLKKVHENRAAAYDELLQKLVTDKDVDTKKEPLLISRFAEPAPPAAEKKNEPKYYADGKEVTRDQMSSLIDSTHDVHLEIEHDADMMEKLAKRGKVDKPVEVVAEAPKPEPEKVAKPEREPYSAGTIADFNGKEVRYKGEPGTLKVDEGGKVTVETDNRIYELPEAKADHKIEAHDMTEPKHVVTDVTNDAATVNGVRYNIHTDEKGNVEAVSPFNNPKQRVTNEPLIKAVEIERNKVDVKDIHSEIDNNADRVEKEMVDGGHVKQAAVNGLLNINMTDTVDKAITKLHDGVKLSQQEALQLEMWGNDAIERLSKHDDEGTKETQEGIFHILEELHKTTESEKRTSPETVSADSPEGKGAGAEPKVEAAPAETEANSPEKPPELIHYTSERSVDKILETGELKDSGKYGGVSFTTDSEYHKGEHGLDHGNTTARIVFDTAKLEADGYSAEPFDHSTKERKIGKESEWRIDATTIAKKNPPGEENPRIPNIKKYIKRIEVFDRNGEIDKEATEQANKFYDISPETLKPKDDAVPESSTEKVLQREPQKVGESGSERGGVEQKQQGSETAGASGEGTPGKEDSPSDGAEKEVESPEGTAFFQKAVDSFNKAQKKNLSWIKSDAAEYRDAKYPAHRYLMAVNSRVASDFLRHLAKKLGETVDGYELLNEKKHPTNHMQFEAYLSSGKILKGTFVYVDDKHQVVLDRSNIDLLDEDYIPLRSWKYGKEMVKPEPEPQAKPEPTVETRHSYMPQPVEEKAAKATVKEINELPLTHVSGLNMGSNQAVGTYISTEISGNRYDTGGNAKKVTVSVEHPLDTTWWELEAMQNELLKEHAAEFNDMDFDAYKVPPAEKFNRDELNHRGTQKLAEILTNRLKALGYDSIYNREGQTQEGQLIVFDKSKVRFESDAKPAYKVTERQGKVNDLVDDVTNYNKMRVNSPDRPAALNSIKNKAQELGLKVDVKMKSAYLLNPNGKKVQRRFAGKASEAAFDVSDYKPETTDLVNTHLDEATGLLGLAIEGEDGRFLSEDQKAKALADIREGRQTVAGKSVYDAFEKMSNEGYVSFRDNETGQVTPVPIAEYMEEVRKIKPLDDDEIAEINMVLGEDELNHAYEQENFFDETEPETAEGATDDPGETGTNETDRKAGGQTQEQRNIKTELDKATGELGTAREAFDAKRKELDKRLNDDRADLFGERKSQGGLFDERASRSARDKALEPYKARVEKAKSEVERLQKQLEGLDGKPSVHMEIEFDVDDKPITNSEKAKEIADKWRDAAKKVRNFKLGGEGSTQADPITAIPAWFISKAIEGAAKVIEASGSIADAVSHVAEEIRKYGKAKKIKFSSHEIDRAAKVSLQKVGLLEQKAPRVSVASVDRTIKPETKPPVTMSHKEALKKQFRDVARGFMEGQKEGTLAGQMAQGRKMAAEKTKLQEKHAETLRRENEAFDMYKTRVKEKHAEELQKVKTAAAAEKEKLKNATAEQKQKMLDKFEVEKQKIEDRHEKEIDRLEAEHQKRIDRATVAGFDLGRDVGSDEGIKVGVKAGVKRGSEIEKGIHKDYAEHISKFLKDAEFAGKLTERQAKAIAARAAKVGTDANKMVDFVEYVEKVIDDVDYAEKISHAKTLQKRLDKFLKSDKTFPNNIDVLRGMKRIRISKLSPDQLDTFIKMATDYKNSHLNPTHPDYAPFNTHKNLQLLEGIQKKLQIDADNAMIAKAEEMSGVLFLSKEEAQLMLEALDSKDVDEFAKNLDEAKQKQLRNGLVQRAEYTQMALRNSLKDSDYIDLVHPKTLKILQHFADNDLSNIPNKQLIDITKTLDNALLNGTAANLGRIASYIRVHEDLPELHKVTSANKKFTIKGVLGKMQEAAEDLPVLLKSVYGLTETVAEFRRLTGWDDVFNGGSLAKKANIEMVKGFDRFLKDNKISDKPDDVLLRGMYGHAIQHEGGSPAEVNARFADNKKLIKDSIEAYRSRESTTPLAERLQTLYDAHLDKFDTLDDAMQHFAANREDVVKAHKFFADAFADVQEDLKYVTEAYHNELFEGGTVNYTPRSYNIIDGEVKEPGQEAMTFNNYVGKPAQNANSITRVVERNLPAGMALDFNFDYAMLKKYKRALYDIHTTEGRFVFSEFMKTPDSREIIGGGDNKDVIKRQYQKAEENQRGMQVESDAAGQLLTDVSGALRKASTTYALGGFTAWFKQYPSVASKTILTLGKDAGLFHEALKVDMKNLPLLEQTSIAVRGLSQGGTKVGSREEVLRNRELTDSALRNSLRYAASKIGHAQELMMKSLEVGDNNVARRSFLAYYMKYLKDQGITVTAKDLPTEHTRLDEVRKKALAYAQQIVDETQVVSNTALMSDFKRAGKSFWKDMARTMFLPFNTFASNTRGRLIENGKFMMRGDRDQKIQAWKDTGTTLAEIVSYQAINTFVIGALVKYPIHELLDWVFGLEDSDPKTFGDRMMQEWKKFYSNTIKDTFVSGFGNATENFTLDQLNQVGWLLHGLNSPEDTTPKHEWLVKNAPFFVYNTPNPNALEKLGAWGIAANEISGYLGDIKAAATGIGRADNSYVNEADADRDGMSQSINQVTGLKKDVKLSDNERHFMFFQSFLDMIALMGLRDADIKRIHEAKKQEILRHENKNTKTYRELYRKLRH